jgi:hypothetical protein
MPKTVTLVAALAVVAAALLWAVSPTVTGTATAESVSVQELHALAHLDALPIQDFDDMSVVYTVAKTK